MYNEKEEVFMLSKRIYFFNSIIQEYEKQLINLEERSKKDSIDYLIVKRFYDKSIKENQKIVQDSEKLIKDIFQKLEKENQNEN